jgi:hypothetical protein
MNDRGIIYHEEIIYHGDTEDTEKKLVGRREISNKRHIVSLLVNVKKVIEESENYIPLF